MANLKFDYESFEIDNATVLPLNKKIRAAFEERITKRYETFIDQINDCDGCYKVTSISRDGASFYGHIFVNAELLAKIINTIN